MDSNVDAATLKIGIRRQAVRDLFALVPFRKGCGYVSVGGDCVWDWVSDLGMAEVAAGEHEGLAAPTWT